MPLFPPLWCGPPRPTPGEGGHCFRQLLDKEYAIDSPDIRNGLESKADLEVLVGNKNHILPWKPHPTATAGCQSCWQGLLARVVAGVRLVPTPSSRVQAS